MRILVTGASGFVGGAFMRRYQAQPGLTLCGVGRRATDLPNYHRIDLSQPFDLPFTPDVVIHAAARAAPWGTEAEFTAQNVTATQNVIDFCRRHGQPRLIYVSTSAVFYQERHQLGLTEDSPIGPRFVNTYARTKYTGEQLVQQYPGEKVIVRPRAVFGPGDTVLFPRILAAAKKGALPDFIGQSQPVMGDLIYIDSLVDYFYRVATLPHPAASYNLTNGEPVEIQLLLREVLHRLNLPGPRRRVKVRTALMAATVLETVFRLLRVQEEPPLTRFGIGVFAYAKTFDPSRTLADLGPPSVALQEGITRFITWQQAQWAR